MEQSNGENGKFSVIGLSLPKECKERLRDAFPDCILKSSAVETREQTSALIAGLGSVVIFHYIPTMLPHMWIRTSVVFNQADVKVIGLHPQCTEAIYDSVLEAEFSGALNADSPVEVYRRAAQAVHRGELWLSREYLSRRTREAISKASEHHLSDRETEVLVLLADGATNQAIADRLYISRDTVRFHLKAIYSKLGVSDRAAAYQLAKNKTHKHARQLSVIRSA